MGMGKNLRQTIEKLDSSFSALGSTMGMTIE
jgi:hypothetical protein